jgi:hypothetical protein
LQESLLILQRVITSTEAPGGSNLPLSKQPNHAVLKKESPKEKCMSTQPSPLPRNSAKKGTYLKRSLAQSDYITVAWTWFMTLAGKAAEPVLVASAWMCQN